ncbi:putative peptidoglycan muropeptide transporter SLC46 isoform X2 [Calliopsis andreniformis]|uniref:putative peptidoglycan muropeptide transporter SLC46 isoform X2 n=1 Tax=Calliopsis andreniformis TaxID=337506 RepID=UPI003FCD4C59
MENTITGWKRYVLVQPPLMVLIFAQAISSNILTDLIVYRTCSITLGINTSECNLLHQNSSSTEALKIDEQVQPIASLILMIKSCIESIFPAILSLFLGPWSDTYGRKPIMISGYIGISLTYLIFSFMTVWDISPWFLLIAYIPYACFGGFCIVLLGTICYITDISDEQDRAWHLAWMEALISVGLITGILIGPIIFELYGYTTVFCCSAICCIITGFYICLLVPETTQTRNSVSLSSLFGIHLVKELITTCTKKRDGFNRYIVWCCIASLILLVVILEGNMTIGYLFASARLGWNVNQYSIYSASNIILTTLVTIVGVKTWSIYGGFSEETAVILSLISSLSNCIIRSFTWKSWHLYLSSIVGMFNGIASPMIRAILSKSVPTKDTGLHAQFSKLQIL